MGAGILAVALLTIATSGMFMTRVFANKELAFLRAQQLEQRLLEAIQDPNNYDFELRNRLRDGARFAGFTLKFGATVELRDEGVEKSSLRDVLTEFHIPSPSRDLSKLEPAIGYYDLEGKYCGTSESAECPIVMALAMIQIAGTYDYYTYGGTVDYLEVPGRKESTTIPVYGLAYRIMVAAPEASRGPASEDYVPTYIAIGAERVPLADIGKFEYTDFATVVPGDVYLEVAGQWTCPDGSLVRGIDPFYQSPVCLKMGANCVKGEIGKQLQISGNTLYVDCVPFRKYECSDSDYVISWISPKYLDSDYSGSEKPGECVYKGVRHEAAKFEDSNRVEKRCGSKYSMDVNCSGKYEITSMCVGTVTTTDSEGNTVTETVEVPPNVGTVGASKSKIGTNNYACTLQHSPANPKCPAGYSGGSYRTWVEMDVSCTLRPEDEYRPLKGF